MVGKLASRLFVKILHHLWDKCVFPLTQKFKMAAKNSGKTIFMSFMQKFKMATKDFGKTI